MPVNALSIAQYEKKWDRKYYTKEEIVKAIDKCGDVWGGKQDVIDFIKKELGLK